MASENLVSSAARKDSFTSQIWGGLGSLQVLCRELSCSFKGQRPSGGSSQLLEAGKDLNTWLYKGRQVQHQAGGANHLLRCSKKSNKH